MGMAASQARFLGLTARKTNVEYEGQQINQQRTTLSNQTASYYTDLLGMSVPVPPSIEDYTKTVYTFTDGALTNSINSMIAKGNGLYTVSYTSEWTDDFAVVGAAPILYTRTNNTPIKTSNISVSLSGYPAPFTYSYLSNITKYVNDFDKASSDTEKYINDNGLKQISAMYENKYMVGATKLRLLGFVDTEGDEYLDSLSDTQKKNLAKEEAAYAQMLTEKYGASSKGWLVRYTQNTTTGDWVPKFVNADVLESDNMVYQDKTGISQTTVQTYTVGSDEERNEIKNVAARLEQDTTGRIISITLRPGEADQVTYAVSTNTVADQEKYDDAMNEYEYKKAQYDQAIQETNAKIEVIQAQDKNLELRLKQLDTEQEAIQTEMDAVSGVIEKNTQSSFKTFG